MRVPRQFNNIRAMVFDIYILTTRRLAETDDEYNLSSPEFISYFALKIDPF